MPFVRIENGVVVQKQPTPAPGFFKAPHDVVCGYLYEDGVFSAPPLAPVKTPSDIHIAWLRAALAEAGNLDAVDAAVASQGAVKRALWEFATTIRRDDTDVMAIADALRIDLDATFKRADEIRRSRGR